MNKIHLVTEPYSVNTIHSLNLIHLLTEPYSLGITHLMNEIQRRRTL